MQATKKELKLRLYSFMFVTAMLLAVFASFSSTASAERSGWTSGVDTSIYGEDDKETDFSKDTDASSGDPGFFEGILITFINSICGFFKIIFTAIGITLSNVVYGRVNGSGVTLPVNGTNMRVALFTFETVPGNVYGIISFAIYGVIRRIIYISFVGFIGAKVASAFYTTNTEKAKKVAGEAIKDTVIAFLMLVIMPWILDLLLYVRDVVLYAVSHMGGNIFGSTDLDICSYFEKHAKAEEGFMLSLMWLGSFFLTLYFAFQYIGVALAMVIDVFAFPFVCVNMLFDSKILGQWWRNVVSNALIPIADSCLLLIVACFSMFGHSLQVGVIQLLVCSMLIPARSELRRVMGMPANGALELGGFMAMRGALGIGGAAMSGMARTAGLLKSAHNDKKSADMYGEMAEQDGSARDMGQTRGQRIAEAVGHAAATSENRNIRGAYNYAKHGLHGLKTGAQEAMKNSPVGKGMAGAKAMKNVANDFMDRHAPVENGGSGGGSDFGAAKVSGFDDLTVGGIGGSLKDTDEEEAAVSPVGSDISSDGGTQTGLPGPDDTADTGDGFSGFNPNMGMNNGPSPEIMKKYANTNNFENPAMFNNLTNAQRAEFYKKRAKQRRMQAVGGAAAGMAGATAAMGATMFMSAGTKGAFMGAVGSAAGGVTSSVIGSVGHGTSYTEGVSMPPTMEEYNQQFFDANQSAILGATHDTYDFENNAEFNQMFDGLNDEFTKAMNNGVENPNTNKVWEDTESDRYDYFRTRAETMLTGQYANMIKPDTSPDGRVRTCGDEGRDARIRAELEKTFNETAKRKDNKALSKDGMELNGYTFRGGFRRAV